MKKTVSSMTFARKTFASKTGLRCGASALALSISLGAVAMPAHANPLDGSVVAGSATISQEANLTTINQSSDRAIIDWRSFSVQKDETTQFNQPSVRAITVNRVTGNDLSAIYGNLRAIGTVVLVNPNGVLFGSTGRVDVGGLIATVNDIDANSFMSGNSTLRFISGQNGQGSIVNEGTITLKNAGLSAFVAPHVRNSGVITASLGQVALGSGNGFTVDLYGDGLLSFAPDQGLGQALSADTLALIENAGTITATRVLLSAEAAQSIVNQSINLSGVIRATSANGRGGVIKLSGSGAVRIEKDAVLSASGAGSIDLKGGTISTEGAIIAEGGTIALKADGVMLGGTISASGRSGGSVSVTSKGLLSLADTVLADGQLGAGGSIAYKAGRIVENSGSSTSASGLTSGGTITVAADQQLVSSGRYFAKGAYGHGGKIDLTADDIRLLSASFSASGRQQGGLVRIGGAFQGGKTPDVTGSSYNSFIGRWGPLPTLQTASQTLINDTTLIDVSSAKGRGGTAIIWSDQRTTFLGAIEGRGATGAGSAEISSAGDLRQAELNRVNLGAGGHLLLDPKNIIIGTPATVQSWAYQGVIGSGYRQGLSDGGFEAADGLGSSVSLNQAGDRLAVGAPGDDGANNGFTNTGAVYLFSFTDTSFGGGELKAIIGKGYTGPNNFDLIDLEDGDEFGRSVSLNGAGDRMAVGASGDDGFVDLAPDSGAVYLFSFSANNFSDPFLRATIGKGYENAVVEKNFDLQSVESYDGFGYSVALNGYGDRLAVGAPGDDGATGTYVSSGAVYLFSFTDDYFSNASLSKTVGNDYQLSPSGIGNGAFFGGSVSLNATGDLLAVGAPFANGGPMFAPTLYSGKVYLLSFTNYYYTNVNSVKTIDNEFSGPPNINQSLRSYDYFGSSVALNSLGNRLAVGAYGDDGFSGAGQRTGAVRLYSFSDNSFNGGALEATIGKGYAGPKDVDLNLENYDSFGSSVALNQFNERLAVGASGDGGPKNETNNSGAVYLFSFDDRAFTGGTHKATVGQGYKDINLAALPSNSSFASSVALNADGTRLAVGMPEDGSTYASAGSVNLFSFSDTNFSGGVLQATIGVGYSGGKNLNLVTGNSQTEGRGYDKFGSSVSLNAAGDRLAVGASDAQDAQPNSYYFGAVYLFSFSNAANDTPFSGARLEAKIGKDYSGGKNLSVSSLEAGDFFGRSVALNAAGDRLAVGAPGDDGGAILNGAQSNSTSNAGAVYLFSLTDDLITGDFSGANLLGVIGKDRTGDKNLPQLDSADQFGTSVALNADGDRLAVGAPRDEGFIGSNNMPGPVGAVYLFSFSGDNFTGTTHQATIGANYLGPKDYDILPMGGQFAAGANFGLSVSLNAAGDRLAVGSPGAGDAGAVSLFSFDNEDFSGASLQTTFGKGFDVNLPQLSDFASFGSSVSLNGEGDRMAVGAPGDNAYGGWPTETGAVYLLSATNVHHVVTNLYFSDSPTGTVTVSATALAAQLATGTAVTLQASNDITVSEAVTVPGSPSTVGTLSLTAGRSILVNANISTQSGNLSLNANAPLTAGVIDAQRDVGNAVITMGTGTSINAGDVTAEIQSGGDKTHWGNDSITLGNISARSVKAYNYGLNPAAGIVLASGTSLTATDTGKSIELMGKTFTNNAGASALSAANGRWLVWSGDPGEDDRGGLAYDFKQYGATYGTHGAAQSTGNGFIYSLAPTAEVSLGGTVSKIYDGSTSATSDDLTGVTQGSPMGVIDGDRVQIDLTNATGVFNSKDVDDASEVSITGYGVTATNGDARVYGYQVIDYNLRSTDLLVSGNITPKVLTVTGGITAYGREYDGTTRADFGIDNPNLTGFVSGEEEILDYTSGTAAFSDKNVGTDKTVTVSGLSLYGPVNLNNGTRASNYSISPYTTQARIDLRSVFAVGAEVRIKAYDGTITATPNLGSAYLSSSNLVTGESVTLDKSAVTATFDTKDAGTNKWVTFSGFSLSGDDAANYVLAQPNAVGRIDPKALTVRGLTVNSRDYDGGVAATLDISNAGLDGVVDGEDIRLDLSQARAGTFADKNAGTGKIVTVSGLSLALAGSRLPPTESTPSGSWGANNYSLASTFTTVADINARTLTLNGITASPKTYDGTTSASLDFSNASLDNVLGSDRVDLATASMAADFLDRSAGERKSVRVSNLSLTGADSANYRIESTLNTTGNITAKALTLTGLTAKNRAYDGTTLATLNLGSGDLSGIVAGDAATLNLTSFTAGFSDKLVGNGKAVTVIGLSLSGADRNNYSLASRYTTSADITPRALSLTVSDITKTYDGLTSVEIDLGRASMFGRIGDDDVGIVPGSWSGAFDSKGVDTDKALTISGLRLTGADAANYRLADFTARGTITPKSITVTGIGAISRDYDGTTLARIDPSRARLNDLVANDRVDLLTASATAAFATKSVGVGKEVSVTGLSLSGIDAGNYRIAATYSASADISAKALTATGITARNKTYDGLTTAELNLGSAGLSGRVGTETVNLVTTSAAGSFATKSVGVGKAVSVTGLSLSGADAGNYRIASTYSASADISAKALTATGIVANNKTFDGNTTASLILSGATLNGVAVGDATTLNTASVTGTFADKAVGAGKVVTISGLGLSGADAGNYSIADATTTAEITADGTAILSVVQNITSVNTRDFTANNNNPSSNVMIGVTQRSDIGDFNITTLPDGSDLLTVQGAEGDDEIDRMIRSAVMARFNTTAER